MASIDWIPTALSVCLLWTKAEPGTFLAEFDTILLKGHKAGGLGARDLLRYAELSKLLDFDERNARIRFGLLTGAGEFGNQKLRSAAETQAIRPRVFGDSFAV